MDTWLCTRTRAEVVELAQALRLPFTEVMEPGEVMAEGHHRERGSFVTIDHPGAGPVSQPGAPIRWSLSAIGDWLRTNGRSRRAGAGPVRTAEAMCDR